jgi:hypothetical protein
MISVVSTGLSAPTREKCMASVAMQVGADWVHYYIEASDTAGEEPRAQMHNFYDAVMALDPSDIIAAVDGDDWLPHNGVLARVQEMHNDGAWVTYGNFTYSDGRPSQMPECRVPYRMGWLSHLKTFRASLFQRIPVKYFQVDGEWSLYQDGAMMSALCEMAGPDHVTYCEDSLYVYNAASSFEFNASSEMRAKQAYHVAHYRRLAPFDRVEAL